MDASIRQTVKDALIRKAHADLIKRCQTDRRYWRALQYYLYKGDEHLRWASIDITAAILKQWWHHGSREKVREYIRRLLWALNEESGGIGWSAPEVIAETIVSVPELFEPYAGIMISNALTGKALLNGTLWAIGRLGTQVKKAITFYKDEIMAAFDSENPETLGLAAWATGEAGFVPALESLASMKVRKEPVRIYIGGHFQEKSLGKWAEEAIGKIREE